MGDMYNKSDEEKIFSIIETHRERAFELVRKQMHEAFEQIGLLLAEKGMREIGRKKINGISSTTVKEIYRLTQDGKTSRDADEEDIRRWFIEFIKAQSLSFEAQKAKYPNFLKQWTAEDDEKLERLWCEGTSEKELSEILMRHPNGIAARIAKLELVEKYEIKV